MAPRVLSAVMFSPRGGSAHVARALAQGLREQGWAVTLVAGSRGAVGDPGNARSFYRDVRPVDFEPALGSEDPSRFEGPPGTAPIHPSYEERQGAPDQVFAKLDDQQYDAQVRAWTRELRRAGAARADLLHVHHLTPLNEAAALAAPHVPIVGHLHGTELLMLERIAKGAPPGWVFAERWAGRMCQWAARCARLIVSPAGVERAAGLLDLPEERFVPLASGVDIESFAPRQVDRSEVWHRALVDSPRGWLPGSPPGSAHYSAADAARVGRGKVLLYVGRFTAVKRLDLVIGAFAQARSQLPGGASLVLVGGHPGEVEGEHPAEIAARLGVVDVYLAGWYLHRELPPFFNAADATVLASEGEQFGLVLIEGMACGLPAIATRSFGPSSIVEDGVSGWLVQRGDEQGLAGAIVAALTDDDERSRRGAAARAAVGERYSWSSISAALGEVFCEVLSEAPASAPALAALRHASPTRTRPA